MYLRIASMKMKAHYGQTQGLPLHLFISILRDTRYEIIRLFF